MQTLTHRSIVPLIGKGRPILRLVLLGLALSLLALPIIRTQAAAPGNRSFQRTWERPDKPVADKRVDRTWMWGPEAFTTLVTESYVDAPGGQRTVQYFDKSRMEITDPSADVNADWYVTNGLLVIELVTGRMQVGDNSFETRSPARVNVAGDADDPAGPTYSSFQAVLNDPAREQGETIIERIDREGRVREDNALQVEGVTAERYVPETRHTVAAPFWTFMTSSGMVYRDGQFTTDSLFPTPYYATGLPITEAYWAEVKVGGVDQDVLIQCFERRCLTYTPGNSPGWQVEAGNVGLHYYAWRYEDGPSSPSTPTPDPSPSPDPSPTPDPSPDPDPSPTPDPGSGSSSFEFTEAWDSQVIENSAFNEPVRIAIGPGGDVYIADGGEHDIRRFSSEGVLMDVWGKYGHGQGEFDRLEGLAIDSDGNVYAADYYNNRVQKFDKYGAYLGTVASVDFGELNGPIDVEIDRERGTMFVLDRMNNRVLRYTLGSDDSPLVIGSEGSSDGEFTYPNGIALDADGYLYVADTQNSRVQKFTRNGRWVATLGSRSDDFTYPNDVHVGPDGRVYVVDSGGKNGGGSIKVWEPLDDEGVEYRYAYKWGENRGEPGYLVFPTGIAMDHDGYIYVSEVGSSRVQKFTSMGMLVDVWTDASRNAFGRPVGIDYGGGYLYVVDEQLHQVKVFTTSGEYVRQWDDQLARPVDVAVGDGYVYVADQKRALVLKFTSEGEWVKSWGGYGDSEFIKLEGVAVDDGGYVYVVDSGTYLVQKFTPEGEYVTSWGGYGAGPSEFESPKGLAIHGEALYVVDSYQSRVKQFDLDGYYVRSWGGEGYMNGQFDGAYGVAVDRDGYVYVADRDNHRIQKFTSEGEYVTSLTQESTGMPAHSSPIAVAAGSGGMLCVVSDMLEGIMIFHPVSSN